MDSSHESGEVPAAERGDSHARVAAFVDTMLFLHFRRLDGIDWCSLLRAKSVHLLIAPVVWRELNTEKDQNRVQGLRERAKDAVAKFRSDWLVDPSGGTVRSNVTIELLYSDADIDFAEFRLNRDVKDDQLIASAIAYKRRSSVHVVIVSDDMMLHGKARMAGLDVVFPAESERLDDALSEEGKRTRALEREIRALKDRRPKLIVRLDSGDGYKTVHLKPLGPLPTYEVGRQLAALRKRFPLRDVSGDVPAEQYSEASVYTRAALIEHEDPNMAFQIALQQTADASYNADVERYLEEYANFIPRQWVYQQRQARSLTFSVVVANDGTAPAQDIDLLVTTGAKVAVYKERDHTALLKGPIAPAQPKARSLSFESPSFLDPALIAPVPSFPQGSPASAYSRVKNGESGVSIHAHIDKLKQRQSEEFGPFVLVYPLDDAIAPVQLRYVLNCEELPEELEGVLHLNASVG
jgi:hypothetical protein